MAKFEVISPDGKKIEIEGEQFPTEKELDEIFKSFDNSDSVKSPKRLEGGISKSIDLTPSGIFKSSISALETPANLISNAVGNALYDDKDYEMMEKISGKKQGKKTLNPVNVYSEIRENKNNPVTDTAIDIAGYALLPQGKVTAGAKWLTKLGALAKTGAIQGAPVALIESLKEKGLNPVENIKDTATGTAIGAGANPVVSGIVSKTAKVINNDTTKNAISSLVEILTSVPKKYTKLALDNEIAGTSIFKDPKKFDVDSAYIPIERKLKEAKAALPDEKYYRSEFQKLGTRAEKALNKQLFSDEEIARRQYDAGQKILKGYETAKAEAEERIQKALNSLPEKAIDKAQLMKDLNDIINSFKRGGTVNIPAIRAKKDINELYDILGLSEKNSNLNPRNLLDLHNIKEDIYDRTIYDNEAGTSVNEVRKALAGKINKTLRDVSPEYAKANDAYAALKKAEYALGGINESTIGKKVSDYNTKDQILSGKDRALRDFEQFLPDENKFISEIKSLQDIKNNQDRIRSNIPAGIFKNLSAMEKNPAAAAELIGIDAAAPSNLQFMDDYRKLLSQEAIQKEMMKRIGSKAYEKNPRLLANFSDEGGEEALKYLQEKSGVNFIDDLEKIRAREALEYGMPGQGGGSGSGQGFGNLVRTSIAGAGAPITKGLSILAVSPKIAGQGTVKNLGRIHNLAEKIASNPESMESKAANVIPLASILKQIIANDTQSQRRNGEINADAYRYRY